VILSAEGVSKRYGEQEVLRDCSLSVKAGECVLLRGPSGGGKSTLLRILALLEAADRGRVNHGERSWDVSRLPEVSAYPFLTLVFQQLFLWPNLTIGQNMSIVLAHRPNHRLPRGAMELLERLTVSQLLERRPHECSLGQRQRLAIARALLSDARFLLLDEPSSALDRANQTILLEELKVALDHDRGVLLITHDDRGYDEIADQSFELENGRLSRL
jgi:ABC-type sulfate/molybdate transport systems ATPase subunit